jgi:predicted transcriptional regulator
MKLTNLFESLDDTKNLEIQNKTQNFYFSTRTGLKCHANFNWPNPISLGLINVGAVVELTDGTIPSNLFSQVMVGAVDYIKTLELEPSDIDKLEIRISSLFVTYMGLEIKMNDLLLQTEKIHYSKRFELSNLINSETEDVYGEILRDFPHFTENLDSSVQNLKTKIKNVYRVLKKGKVGIYDYELPMTPKIEVKLSMDDVRKDSTVIDPKLVSYVYVEKNDVDIKNVPEDTDDATLNHNFFYELMLKFRKFKIKLIISE